MIDHKNKLIFLHIPRTGGHYISEKLGAYIINEKRHTLPDFYKQRYGRIWDQYYKFTFVRNPWDRVVSAWSRIIAKKEKWFDCNQLKNDQYFGDVIYRNFQEFLKGKFWFDTHFNPQMKWIIYPLDFIGKYENLDNDLKKVFNDNNIEWSDDGHLYKSYHRPYKEYYNENTLHIIKSVYLEEIKIFRYTFE